MRVITSVAASLVAAANAADTEGVRGQGLDDFAYLNNYRAYEPSVAAPYDPRTYVRKQVLDAERPAPKKEAIAELKEEALTAHKAGVRGDKKQSRRRDPPAPEETQPVVEVNRTNGRYYDWRDYEPDLYGGKNPYDECVMPKDTSHLDTEEYQSMSAMCKTELIWSLVLPDSRRERFYTAYEFESLFAQDMNLTYDAVTDNMPKNRLKKTHPVGLTSKIEWIPHPDQPYTGIFRGAEHGIMRISDTTKTVPHKAKTAPGFGLKFPRDGMYSANILAMFAFDGQNSFNFFKNRWVTILREFNNKCARATIGKQLATVTDHLGATSVMDVADYDQAGNKEAEPHWPFQIEFEGYDVYGWTDEYQNDFQDQIETIPSGTVMFKVFAFDEPPELGGEEKLIGWIASRSDQLSSFWGDTQLFFQHRRLDDDIRRRPHYFDWLQFWDNGRFNDSPLQDPAPAQKCPFYFLFEKAGLI